MKYLLAILLLVSSAFAQFTVNGSHTISGLGGLGTIGVTNCTTITQSGALPGATQGVAYNTTVTASGGVVPYAWSLVSGSLPSGLTATRSGNSYVISGTPTAVQTSNFTVQVKDASTCSAVTSNLSITVAASNTLTLQSATLPGVVTGAVYPTTVINATGGTTPYASCAITSGALPGGLSVAVTNTVPKGCQISGTVSGGASTYSFTVRITDNVAHTASGSYSITVICSTCGAPTSYSARTDSCETGLESGCSGKGMKFDGSPATMSQVPVLWETNVTASCASPPCHRIGMNKGAGRTVTDPDFGAYLLRASDNTSLCFGGGGVAGPSGGDVSWWNSDSSMFLVASQGSAQCLYYFDPVNFRVTPSQLRTRNGHGSSTTFAGGGTTAITFSAITPNKVFEFDYPFIYSVTVDKATDTLVNRTVVATLNSGNGCFAPTYLPTWSGTFAISNDDSVVTIGLSNAGGQNSGFDVISYDMSRGSAAGCRHYTTANTNGNTVTGGYGCHHTVGGGATCTADAPGVNYPVLTDMTDICGATIPCAIADQYFLHGVGMTPNPKYAHVGVTGSNCAPGVHCSCSGGTQADGGSGGCETYYWEVADDIVRPCTKGCSGHQGKGAIYEYRSNNYNEIDYSAPSLGGKANPGFPMFPFPLPSDNHGTYNNGDLQDAQPVFLAMADVKFTNTQGFGWINRPPYPAPGYGEFIAGQNCTPKPCAPPGVRYRFAHAFNSTLGPGFSAANNIGVVSQDGKFLLFWSDFMGNFGSQSGGETCNMGGGNGFKANAPYGIDDEVTGGGSNLSTGGQDGATYKVTVAGTSGSSTPPQITSNIWKKAHVYAAGAYIVPQGTINSGNNIFLVTSPGTSGNSEPNWDSVCSTTCGDGVNGLVWTNQTPNVTSGTVTFTNIGANDCAGEAVIIDLQSAH